jgi:adenine-specific DNA-methyltransferase
MEERRENQQGKLEFYHLHWGRDEYFFEKGAKILAVRKCSQPVFAYIENEAYVMMAFNVIKSKRIDMKYLSALLNSKAIAFWLKNKGKMQGCLFQVDKEPILNIPIFNTPNETVKNQIIKHVDQLLQLNKDLQTATLPNQKEQLNAKISYHEDQINSLVYELYSLTDEEIRVIEGKKGLCIIGV